jgi:hypothetical protein
MSSSLEESFRDKRQYQHWATAKDVSNASSTSPISFLLNLKLH